MTPDSLLPYRWTIGEYSLRCELDHTIREVFVEGALDSLFWQEVLTRAAIENIEVFDADYLHVTDEEVFAAGFRTGAKGKLLTLAAFLEARDEVTDIVTTTVAIVDHDHDGVPVQLQMYVIGTDGYSVENYAIAERSLERFIAHQFGQVSPPVGASGRRRGTRTTVSGADLLERVMPACVDVMAARRVLLARHPRLGLIDRWRARFRADPAGYLSGDRVRLLRDTVVSGGESFTEADIAALDEERAYVSENPPVLVRGRDFVALLLALLRSPWGRRAIRASLTSTDECDFARWLIAAIAPSDVDSRPAPVRLIQHFTES